MLLLILLAPSFVFAQSFCCPETQDGKLCEDLPSSGCREQCSQECRQTNCTFVSDCILGCCIKPGGGCSESSPQGKCTREGGVWREDRFCGIDECRKGCCIIQRNANLYTEAFCKNLSAKYGTEPEFHADVTTEAACRAKVAGKVRGACILSSPSGNLCRLLTEQECLSKNPPGRFFDGVLCTAQFLQTDFGVECKPTRETMCLPDKDEVYFADDCENSGNIYDASRVDDPEYWERIISKEESCGAGEVNAESPDCGNCDVGLGSVCSPYNRTGRKPDFGNNICKDLRCDDRGRLRQHGEEWCVYDGSIDNGTDIVGSRHWQRVCKYGEIEPQPCADYRNEICLQKDLPIGGGTFSASGCVLNLGKKCYSYNIDEETGKFVGILALEKKQKMVEDCQKDPFCFVHSVDVDSGFRFDVCIPRIAPGFDYSTEEGRNKSKEICGIASQTCIITYVKKFSGFRFRWDCEHNCECENPEFGEKMGNFCARLGDCGYKMNIVGDTDKAYTLDGKAKGTPEVVGSNVPDGSFIESDSVAEEILRTNISVLQSYKAGKGEVDREIVYTARVLGGIFGFLGGGIGGSALGAYVGGITAEWIASDWFGIGDSKHKYAVFKCLPWQAPSGGNKCNKCNDDLLKPCSKYRCMSLGQQCQLVNEDNAGRERCEKVSVDDVLAPRISPKEDVLTEGYRYEEVSENGFKITKEGECADAYAVLNWGIKTDEVAQCKVSPQRIDDFDNESILFIEDNFYKKDHVTLFSSPSPEVLEEGGIVLDESGERNIYVRCKDASPNGNKNERDFVIKVCVNPAPDRMHPLVTFFPAEMKKVRFDANESEMIFYTDEPAECRWGRQDKDYVKMEYEATCLNEPEAQTLFGFYCNATVALEGLEGAETRVYVRCKDKPFDFVNESERNVMTSSEDYVFSRSVTDLQITSLEPSGIISTGFEPVVVDVTATTSGGAEDGKASCEYEFSRDGIPLWRDDFFETSGVDHRQPGISLFSGEYLLRALCWDAAENFAELNASLTIVIDRSPPIITRAFYQGGNLVILTDEAADCRYSSNKRKACNFDFENATRMNANVFEGEMEHTTDWVKNQYYYIKCRDVWGNLQGECGMRVRTL